MVEAKLHSLHLNGRSPVGRGDGETTDSSDEWDKVVPLENTHQQGNMCIQVDGLGYII